MLFDDEEDAYFMNTVREEIYSISTIDLDTVPTHTEDGIPIRKLYVTNMPPNTTRGELFNVFAPYGFIKSLWLRMCDRGAEKVAAYAFVTYSNPDDAYQALKAPSHEKSLRTRPLRVMPADSWHQPAEDIPPKVNCRGRGRGRSSRRSQFNRTCNRPADFGGIPLSPDVAETLNPQIYEASNAEESSNDVQGYSIIDVLNRDCLTHILNYISIRDLIRTERVSKGWQNMIQEHISSMRTFKTSWWQHGKVTLTTAVLRRLLHRLGDNLLRLHIDHPWSALNDRTAHTIAKFCPHLEELTVTEMQTRNWNTLIHGCKRLRALSFVSCTKVNDSSLANIVKTDYLESLTVVNNTHVTGLFLSASNSLSLSKLSFYNCYSLQGTVLDAAILCLPLLSALKLDRCPESMWKAIPSIIKKLPNLEELSLSEYTSVELSMTTQNIDEFAESIKTLKKLKRLDLNRNIYITDAILKQVAKWCTKLESLNVSSCNSRKICSNSGDNVCGVGDEGILAVCRSCSSLVELNVSYLAALSDRGAEAAARCRSLRALLTRGNPNLTSAPLVSCVKSCHELQELDACGCDNVSEEVVHAAVSALSERPQRPPLTLRLASTNAMLLGVQNYPKHKLLIVNLHEDRCSPHLRPDFLDRIYEESSDDSDDIYNHDDMYNHYMYNGDEYDDSFGSDNEFFLDYELDEYDGAMFAYGLHAVNFQLLQ